MTTDEITRIRAEAKDELRKEYAENFRKNNAELESAIPPEPRTCPEDGCPRDGSVHKGCSCTPKTCETCAEYGRDDADCNGDRTGMECIDRSNWKEKPPRSPQSADVEMVRKYKRLLVSALEALYEAIQIAPLGRLPSKAVGVIQNIQATIGDDAIAMHRIGGKEE